MDLSVMAEVTERGVSVFEARMLQLHAETLQLEVENVRLQSSRALDSRTKELWSKERELEALVSENSLLKLHALDWRKKLSMTQLRLASAEEDAKMYQDNLQVLGNQLAVCSAERADLERQIAVLQGDVHQLRSMQTEQQSTQQDHMAVKDQELARLHQQLTELATAHAQTQEYLSQAQVDRQVSERRTAELLTQLTAANQAHTAQQKAMDQLQASLTEHKTLLETTTAKLKTTEAALQASEQQQALAERARAELNTVAQAKTEMSKEWEQHVTRMAEERVKLVNERSQTMEAQLQAQLQNLQQQLEQERAFRHSVEPDLRSQVEALRQREHTLTLDLQRATEEVKVKNQRVNHLETQVQELQQNTDELMTTRIHANVDNLINTLLPNTQPQPQPARPAAAQAYGHQPHTAVGLPQHAATTVPHLYGQPPMQQVALPMQPYPHGMIPVQQGIYGAAGMQPFFSAAPNTTMVMGQAAPQNGTGYAPVFPHTTDVVDPQGRNTSQHDHDRPAPGCSAGADAAPQNRAVVDTNGAALSAAADPASRGSRKTTAPSAVVPEAATVAAAAKAAPKAGRKQGAGAGRSKAAAQRGAAGQGEAEPEAVVPASVDRPRRQASRAAAARLKQVLEDAEDADEETGDTRCAGAKAGGSQVSGAGGVLDEEQPVADEVADEEQAVEEKEEEEERPAPARGRAAAARRKRGAPESAQPARRTRAKRGSQSTQEEADDDTPPPNKQGVTGDAGSAHQDAQAVADAPAPAVQALVAAAATKPAAAAAPTSLLEGVKGLRPAAPPPAAAAPAPVVQPKEAPAPEPQSPEQENLGAPGLTQAGVAPSTVRSRVADRPLAALNPSVLQHAAALRATVDPATKQALKSSLLLSTMASARSSMTAAARRKLQGKTSIMAPSSVKAGTDRLPAGMLAASIGVPKLMNKP